MAYCTADDLLVAPDLQLPAGTTAEDWIDRAAEEIDSRIGVRYVLPLETVSAGGLATLKRLNAQLASGRMLMALNSADDDVHAYGKSLVDEALADIKSVVAGVIPLGATQVTTSPQNLGGPAVQNQDAYSATAAFEAFAFPDPLNPTAPVAPWRPGA